MLAEKINLIGRTCQISTTAKKLPIWQNRAFYLFISLKNRKFTKYYISWFVQLCEQYKCAGTICIVDEPYLFNRMAELAIDELPEIEVSKIKNLSSQIERKVRKVINGSNSKRITILSWLELTQKTPKWMKDEMGQSFDKKECFYQEIIKQVVSVKGSDCKQKQLERYAQFFICEIPVLIYTYYSGQGIVDVYPGDNPELLWQLEYGLFRQELPKTTEFIFSGQKLVYH